MLTLAWNLLALIMVPVSGLWAYGLIRLHAFWPLALTFPLLAALSWGFYPRRFARWRTVVGWANTGLSLGVLGGLGASARPFWASALLVILAGVLLLILPDRFNRVFWSAALLRLRPDGWSTPEPQGREQVLAASPFTLHEVVKVTEQLEGGVVQHAERQLDRLECRYRGEPIETSKLLSELEDWTLARYRRYRRVRRLPLSAQVSPSREVSREEERPLEVYGSPEWNRSPELGLFQVLEGSPFQLWAEFLQTGARHQVVYRTDEAGRQERRFLFVQGHEYDDFTQEEADRRGVLVEKVTLKLGRTGRTLGIYPDLAGAEAEVWARYRTQRATRAPEP